MNCIIAVCFYIYGGLGLQSGYELTQDEYSKHYYYSQTTESNNGYGMFVGEINLELNFENWMYIKLYHLSGINEAEDDYGFNSVAAGMYIPVNNLRLGFGFGQQYKAEDQSLWSNQSPASYFEAQAKYMFNNGVYVKATSIADIRYISVGLSAKFF